MQVLFIYIQLIYMYVKYLYISILINTLYYNSMKYNKNYSTQLVDILMKLSVDKKHFNNFLLDILTPTEYKEIAMRWQIVKQLNQGINQRDIAIDLEVGIATVSRGSRQLLESSGGFKKALGIKK